VRAIKRQEVLIIAAAAAAAAGAYKIHTLHKQQLQVSGGISARGRDLN